VLLFYKNKHHKKKTQKVKFLGFSNFQTIFKQKGVKSALKGVKSALKGVKSALKMGVPFSYIQLFRWGQT